MTLETLVIHAQSWAQSESAAQKQLSTVLARLETAVRESRTESLAEAGAELEAALAGGAHREVARVSLMRKFADVWHVAAETLSLSSILERAESAGVDVSLLRAQRDELRAIVTEVRSRARLLSVMATHHRGVLQELMEILGASTACPEDRNEGVLVDASA